MLTQFFGIKFNPFSKELGVENIIETEDTTELFSRLNYIQQNRGIFLLVGEPGSGKSTALRKFTSKLNPAVYKFSYFTLSTVTVMDFYTGLLMSLGEIPKFKKVFMFEQIQNAILNLYYEKKITPVIILDEIQLLSSSILEDLRLLFNFKMDSENPFILILSGQTQIRNKLHLSINTPLRQRIAIRYIMHGLSKDETKIYIEKLLKNAGTVEPIFRPEAIDIIYSISKGIPRVINTLATASLMYAYAKKQNYVDEESVYQGQKDFEIWFF